MLFEGIKKKPTRYAIGLICGNSGRGADAALVRIKGTGKDLAIKLLRFKHFPYSQGMRTRLVVARKDAREICLLNFELGEFLAEATADMQRIAHAEMCEVDYVASTGFSIAHNPPRGYDHAVGTLQVGEPAVIAERTNLPVVSDFRSRDMAAGGQGGPISAYPDWALFRRDDRTIARVHLGGITSISVLTPKLEDVIAFDAGPGTVAIDGAVRLLSGGNTEYDDKGALALKGVVIDEFLEYLLDHPYFAKVPPKCTSRDEFGPEVYLRDAIAGRKDHSHEDLMATVTSAVSYCIVRAFNRFVKPQYQVSRVIVSGGGALNNALMTRIKNGLSDITVRMSDEYGLPHDAVDAVGTAILGNETFCGTPSNVPHATGARGPVVLGRITPA
ncbi:MAG: anhydro-N-acetylmuramic acid kinase [Candidatus Hydrogenedentes bacterium]|nr:anhydro-N-acetylmuramic acid kinase [Candidatus Hydrogenedentota bacterium]